VPDDRLGVRFGQNHRAAGVADELVGTLDHAVALAGRSRQNLAGPGDLEPLLRGRFGLHLGHFASFSMWLHDWSEFAPDGPASGKHKKPPRHALPGGSLNEALYTVSPGKAQQAAAPAAAKTRGRLTS